MYLIELYTTMPTYSTYNCKLAGDNLLLKDGNEAMKLIDHLVSEGVEFTVYPVGECLIDLSYKYKGKR